MLVTMLDVLNDPAHAALVGWIVSVAVSTALLIVGLIGWMEVRNRKDHRDLGHRIDKLNNGRRPGEYGSRPPHRQG